MSQGYFMLRINNISRASKNIVASASYRSDEKLYSERTDEVIKFKNHSVKPESMILTPNNAPSWASNRERLWNEVDKIEKQNIKTDNPRLAREVLISLPNDIEREVQTEMTKSFVEDEFVSKGMVADVSIHRDDSNNPHAHILLTQRPFKEDKTWGNKTKTRTKYDENGNPVLNKNGNKVREQVRFGELDYNQIRKNWENKLNFIAEREQSNRTYDSRSFEKQGKEELALVPLSREEYRIENNEKKRCEKLGLEYQPVTYYGQINKEIQDYNQGLINEVKRNEENEKMQNAFNDLVSKHSDKLDNNSEEYQTLFERYKGHVGYREAKETIINTHETGSTFGRKNQNDLLKNQLKEKYLDYVVANYENGNNVAKFGFNKDKFDEEMTNEYSKVMQDRSNINSKENKRLNLYDSAKKVMQDSKNMNNEIVKSMYSNSYNKFTDDEKAFIVEEAHKGNFIKSSKVEKLFKENSNIPATLTVKDQYTKASKDIYFSQNTINNSNSNDKDSITNIHVEKAFIETKENELKELKPFIDDKLMNELSHNNFKKVEDLSEYSKSQLIISLEKYDNVNQDEVVNKHINKFNEREDEITKDKPDERHVSTNINNQALNILSAYVNELENQNNRSNSKKKKKKKQQNEQQHR